MERFTSNPLIRGAFAVGSVGDIEVYEREERGRAEAIRTDPRYKQWVRELKEWEKQRKIKEREARAEYLRGLPNEISVLEQYLGEAIKTLRNKRLSNETKLQKAIEQLGESGYFSTEEE